MTDRTRKIIDSAWIPTPDTQWPKHPGAQQIAGEWRYPRFGCDTVQHMIDAMDEALAEGADKDARILAEREWADKVLRLEAENAKLREELSALGPFRHIDTTQEHIVMGKRKP